MPHAAQFTVLVFYLFVCRVLDDLFVNVNINIYQHDGTRVKPPKRLEKETRWSRKQEF
jgi:hypothetical protein